jgi:sodium-dependent phosphate cotransporter
VKLPDLKKLPQPVRIVLFVVALYVFLLSIELLGDGFKGLGAGFANTLFTLTANPLSGLFVGILATSLVQSSSSTTSVVVGLVACGTLDISHAIPIVMGANIGTTITNTLVSFAHVTRKQEFERAFPAAVVHDIFNILSVLVLLPLEATFHPLERASALLARVFTGVGGFTFASPLKVATEPCAAFVSRLSGGLPAVVLVVSLVLLFSALKLMVDMMRSLLSRRIELVVDKYLFGNAARAFLVGLSFTAIVQSSSATTSIAVPMAGAGLLTLRQIFPYALGANVGTTVTAILASLVTGSPGAIQIAFAHLLFNILGSAVWYPLKAVPIRLAQLWGKFCSNHRVWAIVYIVVVFFAIPLLAVILLRRS